MKVNKLVKYLVKWQLSHMESTWQNIFNPNSDKKNTTFKHFISILPKLHQLFCPAFLCVLFWGNWIFQVSSSCLT